MSLIIGTKSGSGNTYNGVGKSLIVELLHFCLGSESNKEFSSKIPDWVFYLEFEIAGTQHIVERAADVQNVVFLDGEELLLTKFREWLEERTFFIPSNVKNLSFRSLLPRFLRRNSKDYLAPLIFEADHNAEYNKLLRNAFLLGIDVQLIATKYDLRKTAQKLENRRKFFKTDPFLKDFYAGGKDVSIQLRHLEDKIKKLDADRENFVVAENYYEMQEQADQISKELQVIKNNFFILNNSIESIEKSLNISPDIPLGKLKKTYGELLGIFKEEALKRIEDVTAFHTSLIQKRKHRLIKDKAELVDKKKTISSELNTKQKELDRLLHTLGETGALDQYLAIVTQISELVTEAQKLRDYRELQTQLSNELAECERRFTDEIMKTNTYLNISQDELNATFSIFERLADEFYPDTPAGISLPNNEGANLLRFDLDVRIENDTSDGINEVRIFCYDLMILIAQKNHDIHFLMHDSRLFSNADIRQRAKMFQIAYEASYECDFQYIATVNPDTIDSVKNEFFSKAEQVVIFEDTVIEELNDLPDNSGKLLGIQVDLQYDK